MSSTSNTGDGAPVPVASSSSASSGPAANSSSVLPSSLLVAPVATKSIHMLNVSRSPFAASPPPPSSPIPSLLSQSPYMSAAAGMVSSPTTGNNNNNKSLQSTPSGGLIARSPSRGLQEALLSAADLPATSSGDDLDGLDSPPSFDLSLSRSSSTHSMASRVKRDAPIPLLAAQILPANVYVQQRTGSILTRSTILKSDQFPLANLREGLDVHVIGAPNFQQVRPYALYSTGQPSVSGIRTVLNLLHLKQNRRRRVQWINLREEPVIYLNNRPFVLRELETPFRNLTDCAGIAAARLNAIETRLKLDVLDEASNNFDNILVHDEVELGEIRACWNSVHESNVKTASEVFEQLKKETYNVDYIRIPVTAESVFEASDIDAIIQVFADAQRTAISPLDRGSNPHFNAPLASSTSSVPSSEASLSAVMQQTHIASNTILPQGEAMETFFVINDQMGRGRSTVGLILIYLLTQHVTKRAAAAAGSSAEETQRQKEMLAALSKPLASDHGHAGMSSHNHDNHDGLAAYRRGEFDIMLRLVRMLKDGRQCKRDVDLAIDVCGKVHHLRDQIVQSFVQSEHARADDQHRVFSTATASYLKRYFYLVCFAAYLHSAPDNLCEQPRAYSFVDWWALHPELQKLMATLTDDAGLMELVHPTSPPEQAVAPSELPKSPSDDKLLVVSPGSDKPDECSLLDRFVFTRNLSVLSKRTIIKSEFFHFATRHQRMLFEHGLPNFRYYENLPLAATAQPNIKGIRNILNLLEIVSRRREHRFELEAEAQHAALEHGLLPLDEKLKQVVAHQAGTSNPVLGHHSISMLNLNRSPSDTSDVDYELAESKRYRGATAADEPFKHSTGIVGAMHRSASLPSVQSATARVLWINMREEPVLFINSEPYLIRDYLHPFRLLTEFNTGMTQERTEQVEEGFKADVLHELHESLHHTQGVTVPEGQQHVKRLVVHEETITGQIRPRYEMVSEPLVHHVQTTREVFQMLRQIGYNVEYYRVPLHVEEVPGLKSFDRLFEVLNPHQIVDEKINVCFNCQKGGRRSTMGMVVCVLMLMHQRSVNYSIRSDAGIEPAHPPPTPAETLASLNLSISRVPNSHKEAGDLQAAVANASHDSNNVHGHTVSISAHITPYRPASTSTEVRSEKSSVSPPASTTPPSAIDPDHTSLALSADGVNASIVVTPEKPKSASAGPQATPPPSSSGVNLPRTDQPESQQSQQSTPPRHPVVATHQPQMAATAIPPVSSPTAAPSMKKSHSSVSIHIEEVDRRDTRARFGRGEYKGILSLIRVLKEGGRVKEEVDVAIDAVGGIVNIRDSIAQAKSKAEAERQKDKGLFNKALKYLESYAYLICFNSYLRERRDLEEEARAAELAKQEAKSPSEKHVQFPDAKSNEDDDDDEETSSANEEEEDLNEIGRSKSTGDGSGKSASRFTFPSFSLWIQSRPELRQKLEELHRDAEDSLKLNLLSITDDQYASVYESRQGHVLVNGSILKSDYFLGCLNKNIAQIIDGAINFRPIDRFPVAGTGIPTARGIRGILEFFTTPPEQLAAQGLLQYAPEKPANCVLWFNLREEPLLYVNESPFVLRDSDNPYVNIENTGINTRRVEAMERQLRRDVLAEAERMLHVHSLGHYASSSPEPASVLVSGRDRLASPVLGNDGENHRFLAADEDLNGNLIAVWKDGINKHSIQTPQQQFLRCFEEVALAKQAASGGQTTFRASYFRTPITDEQAPSPATLNDIVRALETAKDEPAPILLFNCQMGRGRTTTGLIIACLWCIHRGKIRNYEQWLNLDKDGTRRKTSSMVTAAGSPNTPSKSIFSAISPSTSTASTYMEPSSIQGDDEHAAKQREEEFANGRRHGWFRCIQSLVRVLPDGPQIKRQADRVIDHCGTFQNLREVVYESQVLALTCLPRKKPFFVRRGTNYLIRYFILILINAYMSSEVAHDFKRVSFADWMNSRPEIQNILGAVQFPEEFKQPAAPSRRATGFNPAGDKKDNK